MEHGAWSKEQGAKGKEVRAGSKELGEQRAKGKGVRGTEVGDEKSEISGN
jgi:hypothetical protein